MKKLKLSTLAITVALLLSSCGGGGQKEEDKTAEVKKSEISIEKESYYPSEKEALTILKAYADKDIETLKLYAGSAQKMVLDDTYFTENSNALGFVEKTANWKGEFTDIRYYEDEVNFQKYYYAIAAFYESPSGQITGVGLKSTDRESWLMSGFGTEYIKKDDFEALSTELPE